MSSASGDVNHCQSLLFGKADTCSSTSHHSSLDKLNISQTWICEWIKCKSKKRKILLKFVAYCISTAELTIKLLINHVKKISAKREDVQLFKKHQNTSVFTLGSWHIWLSRLIILPASSIIIQHNYTLFSNLAIESVGTFYIIFKHDSYNLNLESKNS